MSLQSNIWFSAFGKSSSDSALSPHRIDRGPRCTHCNISTNTAQKGNFPSLLPNFRMSIRNTKRQTHSDRTEIVLKDGSYIFSSDLPQPLPSTVCAWWSSQRVQCSTRLLLLCSSSCESLGCENSWIDLLLRSFPWGCQLVKTMDCALTKRNNDVFYVQESNGSYDPERYYRPFREFAASLELADHFLWTFAIKCNWSTQLIDMILIKWSFHHKLLVLLNSVAFANIYNHCRLYYYGHATTPPSSYPLPHLVYPFR